MSNVKQGQHEVLDAKSRKLQYLLITQLLEKGTVDLILPDGITLQIGIFEEDKFGKRNKRDDYCSVVASRDGKSATLDSYSLGVKYEPEVDTIVVEDEEIDDKGRLVKRLDVI